MNLFLFLDLVVQILDLVVHVGEGPLYFFLLFWQLICYNSLNVSLSVQLCPSQLNFNQISQNFLGHPYKSFKLD